MAFSDASHLIHSDETFSSRQCHTYFHVIVKNCCCGRTITVEILKVFSNLEIRNKADHIHDSKPTHTHSVEKSTIGKITVNKRRSPSRV